jgi:hypothetical protein
VGRVRHHHETMISLGFSSMRSVVSATVLTLAWLFLAAHARAQTATVQLSADRTSLSVGETFTLQIRAEATGGRVEPFEPPNLSGFDVISRQLSTPMSFQFGFGGRTQVVQSSTIQTLGLLARRPGRYELGPARVVVGGRRFESNRLSVVVVPAGQKPPPAPLQGGFAPGTDPDATPEPPADPLAPPTGRLDGAQFDPEAFLRTVVDKREPWVGEQVTVTIYLYVRSGIRSAPTASREPTAEGFWVHDLLPPQRSLEATEQNVDGTPFRVYVMRRFAAFPLRTGTLTIGAMTLDVPTGTVFDLFGATPQRSLRREGLPLTITARTLPETGRPAGEARVGRYTVEASLDRTQVATGDAVTLTARVRGTGNLRDVRIATPAIDGLSFLEPQIKDEIESPGDRVGGVRTFEWLVVPRRAGSYVLPALGFATFDPAAETYGRAESPPLTLVAAGNTVAEPASGDATPTNATPESADESAEAAATFGPLRTESALRRRSPLLVEAPWFPYALGAPPALWLAALLLSAVLRRARARADANAPQRALRGARKRLTKADALAKAGDARGFYGELSSALKTALEARLGEPVGGFTLSALRGHLGARGMPEDLAARLVDELEGAEFARFSASGASPDELGRARDRAQALLDRIDRFTPSPAERT